MLKKIASFLFIIFVFSNCYSQKVVVNIFMIYKAAKPSNDTIYYNTNRILTWKDFKGIPDTKHFGGAVTASGYAFDADIKQEGKALYLNIGVYVYFLKNQSWKKPSINSDYHLLHEQRHFDLTRLGAENFIKQLLKSTFSKDNYNEVMDSVFYKSYSDNIALQNKYDTETQHSINNQQQLLWNNKVAQQIKSLYQ